MFTVDPKRWKSDPTIAARVNELSAASAALDGQKKPHKSAVAMRHALRGALSLVDELLQQIAGLKLSKHESDTALETMRRTTQAVLRAGNLPGVLHDLLERVKAGTPGLTIKTQFGLTPDNLCGGPALEYVDNGQRTITFTWNEHAYETAASHKNAQALVKPDAK